MFDFNTIDDLQSYHDCTHLKDCVPFLRKIKREIHQDDMIKWFRDNDINTFDMSDIEMYIMYIEKNSK